MVLCGRESKGKKDKEERSKGCKKVVVEFRVGKEQGSMQVCGETLLLTGWWRNPQSMVLRGSSTKRLRNPSKSHFARFGTKFENYKLHRGEYQTEDDVCQHSHQCTIPRTKTTFLLEATVVVAQTKGSFASRHRRRHQRRRSGIFKRGQVLLRKHRHVGMEKSTRIPTTPTPTPTAARANPRSTVRQRFV